MSDEDYNVYDDLRKMWRVTEQELNRLNQESILARLEGYYQ